jgi:hypothetical protein
VLRSSTFTLLFAASFASASAQQLAPTHAVAPIRDAGVFHVATGTWTRQATQSLATLGPDVLYDNTCPSGYFSGLSGDVYVDDGRLPSPTSPAPTGCSTSYRIDGFNFGYCTDQTASTFGTYTHDFYQNYVPCTAVAGIAPTASFALTNLPASPTTGLLTCWNVTIDLTGSGGGSFVMAADADGTFGGTDNFGWAMSSTASGFQTGPVIAGNPAVCPPGTGTFFSGTPGPGTGLGNGDSFYLDGSGSGGASGCFFFGGNPFAGFDLTLIGTACEVFPVQVSFCAGDGSGTACPCGNNSAVGADAGCLNTTNQGGKLRGFGTPSIANDTFVLLGSDMTNGTCLYYQGTARENGGNGVVFGDGLRCASGTLTRLGTKQNGVGASQFPSPGDARISTAGSIAAPGTRTYQGWYRNSAPFCTPVGFNLTNGLEVAWGA